MRRFAVTQIAADQRYDTAGAEVLGRLWVMIAVGVTTGVVVVGAGSRLAMLLLRFTSSDRVRGVTSDDGFIIGRFTLGGTYNLLVIGAAVGVVGAAAYQAVAPWLLGPTWFRRFTVAAASGAVVGSMLVQSDGIDFRILKPLWLAIGLFVALPALFGAAIAVIVDRFAQVPLGSGLRPWLWPMLLLAAFPFAIPLVGILTVALVIGVGVRRGYEAVGGRLVIVRGIVGVAVRAAWLTVAVAGLVALVGDIRDLT
jgi:hypothetical protein